MQERWMLYNTSRASGATYRPVVAVVISARPYCDCQYIMNERAVSLDVCCHWRLPGGGERAINQIYSLYNTLDHLFCLGIDIILYYR